MAANKTTSRSRHSGFALPSSSPTPSQSGDSDAASTDEPLPFPTALSRADFLAPDFSAAAYLSDLHTSPGARHQTLEDLRAELRERSAAISAELLELVNANYTSFLGLGDELRGGEERVEDVRVGLLGFRRAVEEVKSRVTGRKEEVGGLCAELGRVRSGVEVGRRMLELDERVAELEERLVVGSVGHGKETGEMGGWDDVDEGEEEEEDRDSPDSGFVGSSPAKLRSLAEEYRVVKQLADSIGRDLPFVKKMEERMTRCRNTILLDLGTAVKEARKVGSKGQNRILKYLAIYRVLDAGDEAVRMLKEE